MILSHLPHNPDPNYQINVTLGLLVHHTDGQREFAYDREHVVTGQLDKGLDEASEYGGLLQI